ncbi:MAG TPA: hypothetical protein VES89_00610 [Candidatus Competibacteraceae bacterium]|nr:hypothetical protein [Candidatus Competibacteraceae bacterium]
MQTKSQPTVPPAAPAHPLPAVQVADLVLEEVLDRNAHPLVFTGSARQYRADCQAGQFKIGASRMVSGILKLEVVAARLIEGEFFGYPLQQWINLIFVDSEGIVSTILFKTESMDNFLELHRQAIAAGELLLGKAITARMSRRASRDSGQGYYAVEFEVVGEGTYGNAIAHFRQQTAIEGIYRTLLSRPEPHVDAEAA